MALIDQNAKKAYEAVVEVLKGMANFMIASKDDAEISGAIIDEERGTFKLCCITIDQLYKCISFTIQITPNEISNDYHFETVIGNHMVNQVLPNGLFSIQRIGGWLVFKIANKYSVEGSHAENVDTVRYMFERAQDAIESHGDRLIKLANGTLSLNDFSTHYKIF